MALRPFAMIVGAGFGAVDGAVQDADEHAGRVANTRQFSTWVEAAGFGGGLLLDLMRFSPEITDPLLFGGLFGLSRRAGHAIMQARQPVSTTTPVTTPAAMRQFVYNGAGAPQRAAQVVSLREPVGVLS